MPRTSRRQNLIKALEERYEETKRRFFFHNVILEDDALSDDGELGHLSYLNLMHSSAALRAAQSNRYCFRQSYRQSNDLIFQMDLLDSGDNQQWLNDDEFLSKYRVTRDQLDLIKGLIRGSTVF